MHMQKGVTLYFFVFLLCGHATVHASVIKNSATEEETASIKEFTRLLTNTLLNLGRIKSINDCSQKVESRVLNGENSEMICQILDAIMPKLAAIENEIQKEGVRRDERFLEMVDREIAAIHQQTNDYFLERKSQVIGKLTANAPEQKSKIDAQIEALADGNEAKRVAAKLQSHLNEKIRQMRTKVLTNKFSEVRSGYDQFTKRLSAWGKTMQQQMHGNEGSLKENNEQKSEAELRLEQANLQYLALTYECMAVLGKMEELEKTACPIDGQKDEDGASAEASAAAEEQAHVSSPIAVHYNVAREQLNIAMMKFAVSTVNFADEAWDVVIDFLMFCATGAFFFLVQVCLHKFVW